MELSITYKRIYRDNSIEMESPRQEITLQLEVDPTTQIATGKFTLEALQDLVALANSGQMQRVQVALRQ